MRRKGVFFELINEEVLLSGFILRNGMFSGEPSEGCCAVSLKFSKIRGHKDHAE